MRCFVVAGFLLTSASYGPSAIAEPLVNISGQVLNFKCNNIFFLIHCKCLQSGGLNFDIFLHFIRYERCTEHLPDDNC